MTNTVKRKQAGRSYRALQTKINRHFLFNALNAIASATREIAEEARDLIIDLSGFMRYNLELSDELIDVHKELQQVKDYVEIEKVRFGTRLQVDYETDDVALEIPSLLIQPLVGDAIRSWHPKDQRIRDRHHFGEKYRRNSADERQRYRHRDR